MAWITIRAMPAKVACVYTVVQSDESQN